MRKIHSTAIIGNKAEIGDNVEIGPFSIIQNDVTIGSGTIIGPRVSVHSGTTIGEKCVIHDNAVIGNTPQDTSFQNTDSYVKIGKNCIIREGVTIHRGTTQGTSTLIGENCFLMVNSHVAHNVIIGNRVILVNGALLGGYVEVDDGAFISGNCIVHQFVKVGKLVLLGGGSATTADVPPFCITRTGGLNQVFGLNTIGLRRAGIDSEERKEIRRAFHVLYQSGYTHTEAKKQLKNKYSNWPANELWKFLERSERGICKLSTSSNKRNKTDNKGAVKSFMKDENAFS
jgi:UDP-N-acetylglucosamine acyltransferase